MLAFTAVVLPVRSIAGYCCCLRRQATPRAVLLMSWPDEVARPFCFLSPRPSAISENRKRSDGSSRARSVSDEVLAALAIIFFGAPAVSIGGLVRFDDFGMSGSDLRNLCSRCVSECRGGKLTSPSRARAEQCGYLARGTSASVRSVSAWVRSALANFSDTPKPPAWA